MPGEAREKEPMNDSEHKKMVGWAGVGIPVALTPEQRSTLKPKYGFRPDVMRRSRSGSRGGFRLALRMRATIPRRALVSSVLHSLLYLAQDVLRVPHVNFLPSIQIQIRQPIPKTKTGRETKYPANNLPERQAMMISPSTSVTASGASSPLT